MQFRAQFDNCAVWNCVPRLFDVFENVNGHQISLMMYVVSHHTFFKQMHAGIQNKGACIKPATPYVGLGHTNLYNKVIKLLS